MVPEAKVTFLDPIYFGVIPVSFKCEKILRLKNHTKWATVFQFRKETKPHNVTFKPEEARISGSDTIDIRVSYYCKENMKELLKTKFLIDVRGSDILEVPFSV